LSTNDALNNIDGIRIAEILLVERLYTFRFGYEYVVIICKDVIIIFNREMLHAQPLSLPFHYIHNPPPEVVSWPAK
jgi:hypothetical protein